MGSCAVICSSLTTLHGQTGPLRWKPVSRVRTTVDANVRSGVHPGSGLGTLSYVMALNPNLFDDDEGSGRDAQSACGLSAYDVYSSIR